MAHTRASGPLASSRQAPVLYNPASGHGKGKAAAAEVARKLLAEGIHTRLVPTARPGHAADLARDLAADGHERIYVVGGDGTISETARGVLDLPAAERPELACFPAGTGNDFLRDFGILDFDDAVAAATSGTARKADATQVVWGGAGTEGSPRMEEGSGRTWSLNVVGTGLMARAGERTNRDWKWLGRKGYDVAAAIEIFRNAPCPTRLLMDGADHSGDYPLVAACNSVHTGGAMKMAPDARPDDGMLDVVTASGASPMELLMLLATKVRSGRHVENPKVKVRRASRIEVEPEEPSPLLVDGEIVGRTPATLRVFPGALRIAVPGK